MVNVHIHDGDAVRAARAAALGGDRGVIEKAEAAGHVGVGVMPRRPAERVGMVGAGRAHHGVGGREGAVRARPRAIPRAGTDGTGAVRLVPAGAPDDGGGHAAHVAARVDVRNDFRSVTGERAPLLPGALEIGEIARVVHGPHGLHAVVLRRVDLVARIPDAGEQRVRPGGPLRIRHHLATAHERSRRVDGVSVAEVDSHDAAHSIGAGRVP